MLEPSQFCQGFDDSGKVDSIHRLHWIIRFCFAYIRSMKNLRHNSPKNAAIVCALLLVTGCGSSDNKEVAAPGHKDQMFYGSVIEMSDALDAEGLRSALTASGRAQVRFEGEVTATCAKKGCWMDVASGEDTVFVRFQDYGFFVPTEGAEGKRAVMEGEAFFDTITVEMRKHYAEDAGESEEFIAAITEPELRLAFTATGVMIED